MRVQSQSFLQIRKQLANFLTKIALLVCSLNCLPAAVQAGDWLERTYLIDVFTGSSRSRLANNLSRGTLELSDGTLIPFSNWYAPRGPELNVEFLTQINKNFGVLWGIGFGERGEKYTIDPSLSLGFLGRIELGKRSALVIRATFVIGGNFNEKPCKANYGAIGGIQDVNCRLSASILPPAETLSYLIHRPGYRDSKVSLRYEFRF